MSFDEAIYEKKYRQNPATARQYLHECLEEVRYLAKNSSHEDVRARHHSADFDAKKHAEMYVRNPMLANDYMNGYIELLRRKAAVIDAKVNLEESMTATTGFSSPPPQQNPDEEVTQKLHAQNPAPSGWGKLKSLFTKK